MILCPTVVFMIFVCESFQSDDVYSYSEYDYSDYDDYQESPEYAGEEAITPKAHRSPTPATPHSLLYDEIQEALHKIMPANRAFFAVPTTPSEDTLDIPDQYNTKKTTLEYMLTMHVSTLLDDEEITTHRGKSARQITTLIVPASDIKNTSSVLKLRSKRFWLRKMTPGLRTQNSTLSRNPFYEEYLLHKPLDILSELDNYELPDAAISIAPLSDASKIKEVTPVSSTIIKPGRTKPMPLPKTPTRTTAKLPPSLSKSEDTPVKSIMRMGHEPDKSLEDTHNTQFSKDLMRAHKIMYITPKSSQILKSETTKQLDSYTNTYTVENAKTIVLSDREITHTEVDLEDKYESDRVMPFYNEVEVKHNPETNAPTTLPMSLKQDFHHSDTESTTEVFKPEVMMKQWISNNMTMPKKPNLIALGSEVNMDNDRVVLRTSSEAESSSEIVITSSTATSFFSSSEIESSSSAAGSSENESSSSSAAASSSEIESSSSAAGSSENESSLSSAAASSSKTESSSSSSGTSSSAGKDITSSSATSSTSSSSTTEIETTTTVTTTTTTASTTPPFDVEMFLEILANLTYDYDTNLTMVMNMTLKERGAPTCGTPRGWYAWMGWPNFTWPTTSTTTTTEPPPPPPKNLNNTVVAKCFVCGLKVPGIPYDTDCADAFAGDFLPLTPINPLAKAKAAGYRKYCRYGEVYNYHENVTRPKSIYGRWTGGCSVRWTDLTGLYTQRACRNRRHPTLGNHYASKRMAKLELALSSVDNGCLITPAATLLPMSRGISLYARFHACVCTGSWCNMAATLLPHLAVIAVTAVATAGIWTTLMKPG